MDVYTIILCYELKLWISGSIPYVFCIAEIKILCEVVDTVPFTTDWGSVF